MHAVCRALVKSKGSFRYYQNPSIYDFLFQIWYEDENLHALHWIYFGRDKKKCWNCLKKVCSIWNQMRNGEMFHTIPFYSDKLCIGKKCHNKSTNLTKFMCTRKTKAKKQIFLCFFYRSLRICTSTIHIPIMALI